MMFRRFVRVLKHACTRKTSRHRGRSSGARDHRHAHLHARRRLERRRRLLLRDGDAHDVEHRRPEAHDRRSLAQDLHGVLRRSSGSAFSSRWRGGSAYRSSGCDSRTRKRRRQRRLPDHDCRSCSETSVRGGDRRRVRRRSTSGCGACSEARRPAATPTATRTSSCSWCGRSRPPRAIAPRRSPPPAATSSRSIPSRMACGLTRGRSAAATACPSPASRWT